MYGPDPVTFLLFFLFFFRRLLPISISLSSPQPLSLYAKSRNNASKRHRRSLLARSAMRTLQPAFCLVVPREPRARSRPWKIAHIEIRERGGEEVESAAGERGRRKERERVVSRSVPHLASPYHFLHFNYIVRCDMVFLGGGVANGSSREPRGNEKEDEKFLALSRGFLLRPPSPFMALFSEPPPRKTGGERRAMYEAALSGAITITIHKRMPWRYPIASSPLSFGSALIQLELLAACVVREIERGSVTLWNKKILWGRGG